MALFGSIRENTTGIDTKQEKITKPIFYKADSDAKNQLERMKELVNAAPEKMKPQIEQDIKMLSYGIAGEENVAFELNNSYLPIIVLHDLYLEYDGLSAQIDYLIITKKFVLILECKNLVGNIEVKSNGDFIRTTEFKGRFKKEGIYSPIAQNTKHIDLIKKLRLDSKGNILTKAFLEKVFDDFYKTVIVLANPKTIINTKYAPKSIKEQIIRCDQLNTYIKGLLSESKEASSSDKEMYERADSFLKLHKTNTTDYTKKYFTEGINEVKDTEMQSIDAVDQRPEPKPTQTNSGVAIEDTQLYKDLKQYRYDISKAEGVKAYFIFNNAQMEELISTMPKSSEELKKVSGFGDVKCEKYGKAILEIIAKNNKLAN